MRIVVFTGHVDLEAQPSWQVIARTREVEAVLICRQLPSSWSGASRRFWRNVKKHGLLWIPYRLGVAALHLVARLIGSRERNPARLAARFPVERFETSSFRADDTISRVTNWKPDLGISLGAPILKPSLFTIPVHGTLNIHEGAVPEFRGAPPGFWELVSGSGEIGATAHWVDEGLDTGRVVAALRAKIYPKDTLRDVQARAAELGQRVLALALTRVAAGEAVGVAQDHGGTTNRQPVLSQRLALALRLAARRARRRFRLRELAKTGAQLFSLWMYCPARDLVRTLTASHPLRAFNFHRVTHLCRDGMTVSPDVLRRQATYLCRTHDVISLKEALVLIREGRRLRRPAALLTFDDGYRSVYEHARPLFGELGIAGCCFLSTDLVGTDRRLPHDEDNPVRSMLEVMTWPEVHTLVADGWSMGSHSATHARLSECRGEVLRHEVEGSRQTLFEQFGLHELTMAYPYGGRGDISQEARDAIRAAGYAACFSDVFGEVALPHDPLDLDRIELGGDHDSLSWKVAAHGINLARFRG
jgi:peptidoglycan/xylan/chitin deacetylase (PgdA/CDA1 family)/folate-dependent phosphoribosylglycinamide formyltransferase PurN